MSHCRPASIRAPVARCKTQLSGPRLAAAAWRTSDSSPSLTSPGSKCRHVFAFLEWPAVKPGIQLSLLVHDPCVHVQDPRTAFNAAAASSEAAADGNSADVWEAARAAHEAFLGIRCTQLDIGMPDDLALQVRLLLGESGAMHASCQLV